MSMKTSGNPSPEWYLYMIRCADGSLYTGITTDVARRFSEHQGEGGTGAKYLRGKGPIVLVFEKGLSGRSLALKIESRVKKMSKSEKEELLRHASLIDSLISQIDA
jgi:putative endonuclease